MRNSIKLAVVICVCSIALNATTRACSIPVFRYALENWLPMPYEAVIFHSGALNANDQAQLDELKQTLKNDNTRNLLLQIVDLKEPHNETLAALWKSQVNAALPWLVLRYQRRYEELQPIWAARFNALTIKSLLDSPKRREIVRHIGAGDSITWLLLESGNREKDDAAAKVLTTSLKKSEKMFSEQSAADVQDNHGVGLPVKFAFSMLRLARNDPTEELLVATLLKIEPGLDKLNEPLAFPVVGRGRCAEPLKNKDLVEASVLSAQEFFCGPCSCSIKEAIIGRDLLLTADWTKILAGEFQIKDKLQAAETGSASVSANGVNVAADNASVSTDEKSRLASADTNPAVSVIHSTNRPIFGIVLALTALILLTILWKKKALGIFGFASLSILALCAALVAALRWNSGDQATMTNNTFLVVYCAAGIKTPVEAIVKTYEQEYGVAVHLQYGPSEGLLANIKIARKGDLYLPADESYLNNACEQGLVNESMPLALMRPVIAVRKGNPKNIKTTADLQRADARVALAGPSAAIGKLTRELLRQSGEWEALNQKREQAGAKIVEVGTVPEVANNIKIDAVDAGIIWDAMASQYPELDIIRVALFDQAAQKVAVGVLSCSRQPSAASHFARYLAASDKGLIEFKRHGYEPMRGIPWVDAK